MLANSPECTLNVTLVSFIKDGGDRFGRGCLVDHRSPPCESACPYRHGGQDPVMSFRLNVVLETGNSPWLVQPRQSPYGQHGQAPKRYPPIPHGAALVSPRWK